MKWPTAPLGDVANINWGDTSTTKAAYTREGFPAYSASGRDGFLPYADHHEQGVVISAIGAQCGKTWLTESSWSCIKNTMWMRGLEGRALTTYLYFATADPSVWPRRGAAQPFIGLGDARRMAVAIPPLPVQRKITRILCTYDEFIENNRRRIKLLEEMAGRIYREWFVDFRYPGHQNSSLVDSELGRIPQSWKWRRVGDVGTVVTGSTPPSSSPDLWGEFLPFLTPTELSFDTSWCRATRGISELGARRFRGRVLQPGAICFTCIGTIGKMCLTRDVCLTNQQVNSVIPNPSQATPWYVFYRLQEDVPRIERMAGGVATPILSKSAFQDIQVLMPPVALQGSFDSIVKPIQDAIASGHLVVETLQACRDLLLPRLISGDIDVDDLDIKVPEAE